jgi:hypothetical protein
MLQRKAERLPLSGPVLYISAGFEHCKNLGFGYSPLQRMGIQWKAYLPVHVGRKIGIIESAPATYTVRNECKF